MEQRLIDANELNGIEKLLATAAKTPESKVLMGQVLFDIESMPTVDPVHAAGGCYCRECNQQKDDRGMLYCLKCRQYKEPTDFCSDGERRE